MEQFHDIRAPFMYRCLSCGVEHKSVWKGRQFCNYVCASQYVPTASVEEWFWLNIDKDGPVRSAELGACWLWPLTMIDMLRLAYILQVDGVRVSEAVFRKCGTHRCLRGDHLFVEYASDLKRHNALLDLTSSDVALIKEWGRSYA